jgi:hypothetical protein
LLGQDDGPRRSTPSFSGLQEVLLSIGVSVGIVLAASASLRAPQEGSALGALRQQFGESIEYEAAPAPVLRYCPDNTCEAFKGTQHARQADVAEFALLYLWGISDYTYLRGWHDAPTPPAVREALHRHDASCSPAQDRQRLACALRALAKTAGIRGFVVRYDEGDVAEEEIDLEQQLGRLR